MFLQYRQEYIVSGHTTLQNADNIPDQFNHDHHHLALAYEYYSEAYEKFLEGGDDFPAQDQKLEDRYGKRSDFYVAVQYSLWP